MNTFAKLFLSAIALVLIFAGGVTFMATTVPGVALLAAVWGLNPMGGK